MGIGPVPSMGEGELLALVANSQGFNSAIGGTELGPTNTIAQTCARNSLNSVTLAPASGTLQLTAIFLAQGMIINNFNYLTGTTAGAGLTNQWMAVYTYSATAANIICQATSANGLTAAIGASATITYPVSSYASYNLTTAGVATYGAPVTSTTWTVPYSGIYYLGWLVTNGTTQPTTAGLTNTSLAANTIAPILSATSSAGLTVPPTPGTTAAGALTAIVGTPYQWLT
jgi:hypothetical protein